nr:hypothetical protein [Actinomycetota bacterium]
MSGTGPSLRTSSACSTPAFGPTANLSLVAALCGRQLEIFDSFGGLPEPSADDRAHTILHRGERHTYEEGSWAGTMEEVKDAIARYGAVDVCSFNAGYFDATLPAFGNRTAFVFADVDLRDSVETCVRFLWPLLSEGDTSSEPIRKLAPVSLGTNGKGRREHESETGSCGRWRRFHRRAPRRA